MRERAITFGPANLVGILTQPDPEVAVPEAPGVVILNSGILHRAGASRMYVQAARALAEEGLTTLRFDFSGIGDSEVRRGESIAIEKRFIQEAREAMDYMETVVGLDRFVVGGLCSGADGAFWTGLADDRVVGVWQIDGFSYTTRTYWLKRYLPKLLNPRAWAHSIRVRIAPSKPGSVENRDEVFVKPEYRRIFPPREEVHAGLAKLVGRGTALYFFFTGAQEYLYRRQHHDAFPGLDLEANATVEWIGECSHTMTDLKHQEIFLTQLRGWARENLPRWTGPATTTA